MKFKLLSIFVMWSILKISSILVEARVRESPEDFHMLLDGLEREGMILCICFTLTKLIEISVKEYFDFSTLIVIIFVLYAAGYGLLAYPYMYVSFFQPLSRNIIIYFIAACYIVEWIIGRLRHQMNK
jgi:hypothetical protein